MRLTTALLPRSPVGTLHPGSGDCAGCEGLGIPRWIREERLGPDHAGGILKSTRSATAEARRMRLLRAPTRRRVAATILDKSLRSGSRLSILLLSRTGRRTSNCRRRRFWRTRWPISRSRHLADARVPSSWLARAGGFLGRRPRRCALAARLALQIIGLPAALPALLSRLEPPRPPIQHHHTSAAPTPVATATATPPLAPAAEVIRPGRDTPGPVADPDPALMGSTPDGPLPRIAR